MVRTLCVAKKLDEGRNKVTFVFIFSDKIRQNFQLVVNVVLSKKIELQKTLAIISEIVDHGKFML
jgi:hypothetical protein